ncbi:DUF7882 family protein [Agromyces aerolatus]|uniref:DUF7882 family protein n=1 Tax=Agromyces sp. LY-1074 TaxID=3074080 RepID=UPI002864A5BF|nr:MULTISPECIES: hypothetical protein [unclassified Agromyces]MDR5699194.1 hypothetical protein [Agromyces sp. LY-1074]MDR5705489.1 hypothetical protein [Agromyces sp. LY-1358]
MGTLYYGTGSHPVEIDDRLLAYLKVVIAVKLRRNEAFTLTWKHGPEAAPGRSMIWLQPSIPLRFVFDGEAADPLSRAYLDALVQQANSTSGVTVDLGDPGAVPVAPARPAPVRELSDVA